MRPPSILTTVSLLLLLGYVQPTVAQQGDSSGQDDQQSGQQQPKLAPVPEETKSKPLQGGVTRNEADLQGEQSNGALTGGAEDLDWFHPVLKSRMSSDDFRKLEFGITGFHVRRIKVVPFPTVIDIYPGCPAEHSGLEVGDVVVQANKHKFTPADTPPDYWRILDGPAGSTVAVTVLRNGESKTFKLVRMNIEDIPDLALRKEYELLMRKLGTPNMP